MIYAPRLGTMVRTTVLFLMAITTQLNFKKYYQGLSKPLYSAQYVKTPRLT